MTNSLKNNMKNILIIGVHPEKEDSIESIVQNQINSELAKNYNVNHLYTHTNGDILKKLLYMIRVYICFPFILLFNDIKLIHFNASMKSNFFRKIYFLIMGKLCGKKVILHMHSAMPKEYFKHKYDFIEDKINKLVFDSYDAIIVISEYWSTVMKNYTNRPVFLIYNPIPIPKTLLKRNMQNDKIKVFTMHDLNKQKGTYDIIEATKYIQNPNVIINLYGNGNIEELQKIIDNNNLQEKIVIKGLVTNEEKTSVYKESDIYILPSYKEGMPISVLEAMTYGLPIISTPIGATSEAVEDGINGFLIQPGDYKALAEKIDLLAGDKKLREKMGQESYRIAKENFDIDVIIKQLQEIYTNIIN